MHSTRIVTYRCLRTVFAALFLAVTLLGMGAQPGLAAQPSTLSTYSSSSTYSSPYRSAPGLLAPSDAPIPAPAAVSAGRYRYFPQTGHFLRGVFLRYWETYGGTAVLGLPITEALLEDGLTVQYLERARLEWHPQNPDPRNQVLLTRLGAIMTQSRGVTFPRLPAGSNTPTSFFFVETGHNLSNAFLQYWLRNGGLAVFGYPISEELVEVNQADGRRYTVQYFERNRFEWHPELPPAFNVQLGLLGVEYATSVGLNPLARLLLPGPLEGTEQDLTESPELAALVEDDLLPAVKALGRTPQFRWVPAVLLKYNVHVEFSDIEEEGVAGSFVTTRSRSRPYLILLPESEREASMEALASVLAHEATHAYDVVTGALVIRSGCSIEGEMRAYMNSLVAWIVLKGPDALSLETEEETLDDAVRRSLRRFNAGRNTVVFNFDPEAGRNFLQGLYGDECGR